MFNLILRELWADLKHHTGTFLRALFLILILNYSAFIMIRSENALRTGQISDLASAMTIIRSSELSYHMIFVETLILLVSFCFIFREIPLRMSRGIYVCPAGIREKKQYLLSQLGIKLLFCFTVPALILYIDFGRIFISDHLILKFVQVLLWFFTFYNINLRIGTGEKNGRETDEKGYRIISHAEEMVTVYWLCLLILEWIGFLVFLFADTGLGTAATLGIWGVIMILNLFFALRYTGPLLHDMVSYEKIYCQRPPEPVVQYDL